jgi:hypothetical protein
MFEDVGKGWHGSSSGKRELYEIPIAQVLTIYREERGAQQANQAKLMERLRRLDFYWKGKSLADINGRSCRDYVQLRGSPGGARRDLEDLRAAINYHAREGLHEGNVRVALLPRPGEAQDRWLRDQR